MIVMADWIPKTELGKEVAEGRVTSLDEIFAAGRKIKESRIVDKLLPGLQNELIFVGGSPGKGGGNKKTPTKRTAKMHRSGRRYSISAVVVVGDGDKYIGIGKSEALENREAIEKAMEKAKLNIMPVRKGCGSWECMCGEGHSIPLEIEGKRGSVRVVLKPAPKGVGLVVSDEAKKIMRLAGIKDIWSTSFGETHSRINYVDAIYKAFKKINSMRLIVEESEETAENIDEQEK
ncbi:MAG: 30S ribosomal protein S5 [Candidatus Aenigmarchaeota archaeon]|nr:30S ribosomal protein S5 [Candidatus Aenigmarchaeota archaeon]